MASWEQIQKDIRRGKAKIRLFLRYAHQAGIRPFYGQARLCLYTPARGEVLVQPAFLPQKFTARATRERTVS